MCAHKKDFTANDGIMCFMYMVTFHYHALRLIQEKFSLATNLHKVIKLISNKEL